MRKNLCTFFACLFFVVPVGFAGSATWSTNPEGGGTWDYAPNWNPNVVPNSPDDIATFGTSTATSLVVGTIQVGGIVFEPGASAYTFTCGASGGLGIYGAGMVNDSGTVQNFDTLVPFGVIGFTNSASAGSGTVFTAVSGRFAAEPGGSVSLLATSNGGSATFIAQGSQFQAAAGKIILGGSASAVDATMIAEGGAFNGGAVVTFDEKSSMGAATLIANYGSSASGTGGILSFVDRSSGGTGRVILYGDGTNFPANGFLALAGRKLSAADFSIGSLEGDGLVSIGVSGQITGTLNLNIGGNNLSTTFGGVISGASSAGSITKVGAGTLTLTNGANTYTGGTNVNAGTLLVSNATGLGAGGPIKVNAGTLGGSGTVFGPVTVGLGNGAGAILAPAAGIRGQATFTSKSLLTFKADSTYVYTAKAKGRKTRTDLVVAAGVTIENSAVFSLKVSTQGPVTPGTVLTAISNSAGTLIAGAFSNLPDGGLIAAGGTTFMANYEGGDGNDLTLVAQ